MAFEGSGLHTSPSLENAQDKDPFASGAPTKAFKKMYLFHRRSETKWKTKKYSRLKMIFQEWSREKMHPQTGAILVDR